MTRLPPMRVETVFYDRPDLLITNLPPWHLVTNKFIMRHTGLSNTALRMRENRGRFGSEAPRSWFSKANFHKLYFVHDINDLFRNRVSFALDCQEFLQNFPGPPGIFSDATDFTTRIRTLESGEFYGPPQVSTNPHGTEMWFRTIALRLTGEGDEGFFTQWLGA